MNEAFINGIIMNLFTKRTASKQNGINQFHAKFITDFFLFYYYQYIETLDRKVYKLIKVLNMD